MISTLRPAPSRSFSVNSFPLVVMTYTGGGGDDEDEEEERRWRMPVVGVDVGVCGFGQNG